MPDNYAASAGIQPPGHDLAGISDFDFRRYDNDYGDTEAPWKYFQSTATQHRLPCRRWTGRSALTLPRPADSVRRL
jgi:hypothetical protein